MQEFCKVGNINLNLNKGRLMEDMHISWKQHKENVHWKLKITPKYIMDTILHRAIYSEVTSGSSHISSRRRSDHDLWAFPEVAGYE